MRQRIAIGIGSAGLALLLVAALAPEREAHAGSTPVSRGAELFATRGCAHCHGEAGVGGNIGPDLQRVRRRLTAAAMEKQIHDGGQAMPAFGDQLSGAEIKDLVDYLRARRRLVPVPPKPAAPPAEPPSAQ